MSKYKRTARPQYKYRKWCEWEIGDYVIFKYLTNETEQYKGQNHNRAVIEILESNVSEWEEGDYIKLGASTIIDREGMVPGSQTIKGFVYDGFVDNKAKDNQYHKLDFYRDDDLNEGTTEETTEEVDL